MVSTRMLMWSESKGEGEEQDDDGPDPEGNRRANGESGQYKIDYEARRYARFAWVEATSAVRRPS